MNKILDKVYLHDKVVQFIIKSPDIAKKHKAGQFIILMLNELGERIPLTIVNSNKKLGTITIIFQLVGLTTKKMALLKIGESIPHILGPLGNPTEIKSFGNVICIGGGVGTAVIYPIAKMLKKTGNKVFSIIGAKTKKMVILKKEMIDISNKIIFTTDDGSYGLHGFVTTVLENFLNKNDIKINRVFAIGPVPMMKIICNITKQFNLKTIVSLNPIMVDGTGMCGACRVSIDGETKFGCIDGPEFDGHKVDFDLLNNRLKMYIQEEKEILECCCNSNNRCK